MVSRSSVSICGSTCVIVDMRAIGSSNQLSSCRTALQQLHIAAWIRQHYLHKHACNTALPHQICQLLELAAELGTARRAGGANVCYKAVHVFMVCLQTADVHALCKQREDVLIFYTCSHFARVMSQLDVIGTLANTKQPPSVCPPTCSP